MLCIIGEVILTIAACVQLAKAKKPWGLGFLPIICNEGLQFLIGLSIGSNAHSYSGLTRSINELMPFFVCMGIASWLILIGMIVYAQRAQKAMAAPPAPPAQPQ